MTDKEFNLRMERIDNILCESNIPIFARPFQAIHLFSTKYKLSIIFGGKSLYKSNDKYDEINLSDSIDKWFEKRYGDKLKADFSRGKVAIMIKGDVFKLIIPLIFGEALVGFSTKNDLTNIPIENGKMLLNVADFIEELNNELATKINSDEGNKIVKIYGIASELFNLLENDIHKNDLCKSAIVDFNLAVDSLFQKEIGIGHSKWASLQAIEKITKSVLNHHNLSYPKTHNLRVLFSKLKNICFSNISDDLINTLQCQASIRYERSQYTLKDAITAHHYSLYLSKELLKCCV